MTTTAPAPTTSASPPGDPLRSTRVLGRLAGFVLAHRKAVIVFWTLAFLAGGTAAGHVSTRLTADFSLPGQPGYETGLAILHTYGNGGETSPDILVVTVPPGESVAGDRQAIGSAFDALRQSQPELRVIDQAVTGDSRFVTKEARVNNIDTLRANVLLCARWSMLPTTV